DAAAPVVMNDAVSETAATSAALPAAVKKKPRTMVAGAAAGGKTKKRVYMGGPIFGRLPVAVNIAIPLYKYRQKQKQEIAGQQAEQPAAPDTPAPASPEGQQAALVTPMAEQVEVRASDPPSEGVEKPARLEKERPEKPVTEVPYVEPPAKTTPDAAKI